MLPLVECLYNIKSMMTMLLAPCDVLTSIINSTGVRSVPVTVSAILDWQMFILMKYSCR